MDRSGSRIPHQSGTAPTPADVGGALENVLESASPRWSPEGAGGRKQADFDATDIEAELGISPKLSGSF